MEDVDGSGFSLTIPAMLITHKDASILIEHAGKGDKIKLQASLEITHSEKRIVELSVWYSTTLDLDKKLLEQLYDYQHMMQDFVRFTPHILTMKYKFESA